MIRRGIDLDLHSLDRFSMLVHGDYNTFKTYLVGSFLAHLIGQGKTVMFWNVKGAFQNGKERELHTRRARPVVV